MRRSRILGSTTARVALILMIAQIASMGLGVYLIYGFTQRTVLSDVREAVSVARDDFVDDFKNEGVAAMKRAITERLEANSDRDFVVFVRAPDGSRLVGNLRAWPSIIGPQEKWRIISLYRDGRNAPERIGLLTTPLGQGYALLTGHSMEGELTVNSTFEKAALYAMALSLILSAAIAMAFAWMVERRIDRFSTAAQQIEKGDLAARVDHNRGGDAFDRLGLAINAMLDRIEGLVGELRMVTDSMAHDLRTPVARMKAGLERAMSQTQDKAALDALNACVDEADRLHAMLNSALEITRAEAGIGRDQFTRFQLDNMLESISEVYGPVAEDSGRAITPRIVGPITVFAHRDMLTRAISNLIDNALKYAEGASEIQLTASPKGKDNIEIAVVDNGPGIPAGQFDEARRRFARLDPARTETGSGLGLSLVETIAHLHGGTMDMATANPHGLRVSLLLPIVAPD